MSEEEAEPVAKVVRAERFELVDKNGVARGAWSMKDDFVRFQLLDAKRQVRIAMYVTKDGEPTICFLGKDEDDVALVVGINELGNPVVSLAQHQTQVTLMATEGVTGLIVKKMEPEEVRATVGLLHGEPVLQCGTFAVGSARLSDVAGTEPAKG